MLLLLLLPAPAWPARWLPVVEGPNRAVYLDTAGLARDGGLVRAWVREVYTEEQRSDQVGVLFFSANSLVSYDCERRTWAPLFRVFYGGDGTELRRVNLDAAEVPALASPGSLHENLLDRACRHEAKGKAARPAIQPEPARVAQAQTTLAPTAVAAGAQLPAPAAKPEGPATPPAKPQTGAGESPAPATAADHKPAAAAAAEAPAAKPPKPRAAPERARPRTAAYDAQRPRTRRPAQEVAPAAEPAHQEAHWSYSGPGGPDHWGRLKPDYALCGNGERQSPIDIKEGARLELPPIVFDYQPAPLRIVDNGHTVQVNYPEGSTISVAGERFELKQFHFHKPAEERIDGRAFDMVAHLVHRSLDGRLAVVAVLLEAREQPQPFVRSLWPYLPLEQGREIAPKDVVIDVNTLLPQARTYFAYMGSLTTPPCSEGVLWLVLKTPVEMAPEQVAVFGKLYEMNARPLQPAHGRLIKESQ
jgi:carbonic anhydrase